MKNLLEMFASFAHQYYLSMTSFPVIAGGLTVVIGYLVWTIIRPQQKR